MRISRDEYFLDIADVVAKRSTCDRLNVGAVIVRDFVIVSTGYNGAPRGLPHCDDAGHELLNGHCVRTVHAEANAITQAARSGIEVLGGTMYVTHSPCYDCFKMIVNSGIVRVAFRNFYMGRYELGERVLDLSKAANIKIEKFQAEVK